MSDLNRGRRQGFLVAILICVSFGAAYAWYEAGRGINITDEQLRILIREKFVPVEVVKEITNRVEVPVEVREIITERVEVEVPGEPVEVIREILLPAECPDPLKNLEIGGGCDVVFAGTFPNRMVQGWWRGTVVGDGWEASRGPVLSSNVKAEVTGAADRSTWRRRLWAGAVAVGDDYGPWVGATLERRRWAVQAGLGVVLDNEQPQLIDAPNTYSFQSETEMVLFVGLSRSKKAR